MARGPFPQRVSHPSHLTQHVQCAEFFLEFYADVVMLEVFGGKDLLVCVSLETDLTMQSLRHKGDDDSRSFLICRTSPRGARGGTKPVKGGVLSIKVAMVPK